MGIQLLEVGKWVFSFPYVGHVIYYNLVNQKLVVFAVFHKSMVPIFHLENSKRNS
jgi:toxin ParE1/3/4